MKDSLPLFSDEEMEQLAQTCASRDARPVDSELKQFTKLQGEARKCAKAVASTGRLRHQAAWDALMPILDKMQKLLSQRGANHREAVRGLPEWGFWWQDFSRRNRLSISFRTIQYRLNRYRGVSGSGKQHCLRATRQEQINLAITAQEGHRIAAACISGMGSVDAARHFYGVSLPLETVEEIKERLFARKPRTARGNRTASAQSIMSNAGPQIRECIEGLSAAEAAILLESALVSMIDKFCPGTGIRAKIECEPLLPQLEAGPIRTSIDRDAA